jgi:hypothetical protein
MGKKARPSVLVSGTPSDPFRGFIRPDMPASILKPIIIGGFAFLFVPLVALLHDYL